MSLYYISNVRSSFLKRRGKFFLNSILENLWHQDSKGAKGLKGTVDGASPRGL